MQLTRTLSLALAAFVAAASALSAQEREPPEGEGEMERPHAEQPRAEAPQPEELTIDEQLAERGEMLWMTKGCDVCHGIGRGRLAGPDLVGVTQRRSLDWLRDFLLDPREMVDTDETARQLAANYNNIVMPDLDLNMPEINALLHYIARESRDEMARR